MRKLIGTTLLIAGLASAASAGINVVPEIDSATAVSAITLIAGAVLVIKARKK
ncbi:MAG TPA: hypothetical protein VFI82_07590 [Terriglobales bacterium]|nr:hypothetical protein [Terriglobales bacterium]